MAAAANSMFSIQGSCGVACGRRCGAAHLAWGAAVLHPANADRDESKESNG
eukprot:CAMPEP_0204580466 /NCGR_PEP_ID=MMETSP0661-20131031/44080_1 /ASSEMBLY_ACC=CAM_ASM_000606 /TAXON_ID=109239 /ORGANISM="Alexandrium margalefi, Strain AMGDE01CS-322" /LENGTH=50 /DNA_ID=CAMNT_0051589555 /DNA_START=74 /DNA_END=223 /DNA_ORIENTATION=-